MHSTLAEINPAPILIPLFIAGFIALAIYGALQAKKRREAMAAWAASLGFSYSAEKDYSFDERFPAFQMLRQGDNRYAYNICRGEHGGRGVCGFDYHYETHTTDSKGNRQTHHHAFSAVLLDARLPLKPLLIRPEGIFDKVKGFLGFEDINFESAEFSRTFYVSSPDKKWAFDVIPQTTMEFLLASPRFTMEFAGREIFVSSGGTFSAEQFEAALVVVEGVLARLPDYLLREMGVIEKPTQA